MTEKWTTVSGFSAEAEWKEGARKIFDYRDLGIKAGTNGDYVANILRANGNKEKDEVQQWHVHDCNFIFALVLNGWAEFEFEGIGVRRMVKGDCVMQTPMMKHREIAYSDDFEVLELISPSNYVTHIVDPPADA